jgi:hypothetical protein
MQSLHLTLIAAHAATAVVALALGAIELRPREAAISAALRVYLGALWLMALFLLAVVAVDWMQLDQVGRILFGALTLFAFYISWRGWRAYRNRQGQAPGWERRYVDDVGFTLISLFAGFIIIAALDLGAPAWLVILIGVLGVLGGRLLVGRVERGVASEVG